MNNLKLNANVRWKISKAPVEFCSSSHSRQGFKTSMSTIEFCFYSFTFHPMPTTSSKTKFLRARTYVLKKPNFNWKDHFWIWERRVAIIETLCYLISLKLLFGRVILCLAYTSVVADIVFKSLRLLVKKKSQLTKT